MALDYRTKSNTMYGNLMVSDKDCQLLHMYILLHMRIRKMHVELDHTLYSISYGNIDLN